MERMPETRGKARIFKVFRFLRDARGRRARPTSATRMKTFVAQNKRRGLAVLVSDLYDPAGFERGHQRPPLQQVRPVRRPRRRPGRGEAASSHGDVLVYDCETGDEREVTVTAEGARALRRGARASTSPDIERFCATRQVPYVAADVDVPFDELILRVFRRGGFLR